MSKHPFKSTIPLLQHTPMIHFQANQQGSTLRGTDLKPKIDAFIWRKLKHRAPELFQQYAELITEQHFPKPSSSKQTATAYRIHLAADPVAYYVPTAYMKNDQKSEPQRQMKQYLGAQLGNRPLDVLGGTPYFANVDKISKGKWSEVRLAVQYQNVRVEVFSPIPKVKELVAAVLPFVLAEHNFGTRSSKGFGHFSVGGSDLPAHLGKLTPYRFRVKVENVPEAVALERLFEKIDLLYKSLRSGINMSFRRNGLYFKSLIFKYFYDRGIQWDKKSIKQHFYLRDLEKQEGSHQRKEESPLHFSSSQEHLVRDLLGLASSQDWLKPYNDTLTKASQPDEKTIERFASPIWFKPVRSRDRKFFEVYVGANSVPGQLLHQGFAISSKNKRIRPLTLTTPDEFDVHDFLQFAFEEVELAEHVDGRFHNSREYRDLAYMYDSIRRNQ
ncbi:MAG: hypothetical protein AAF399_17145 [Bacteroidota bacterium]